MKKREEEEMRLVEGRRVPKSQRRG